MPPLTSVIIPCWNALALTRVCLRQTLRWTTLPFELILIDNGSRDGTGDWLKSLRRSALGKNAGRHLRGIRIIRNRENRGYTAAMNQGISAARGEWLLLGNSDAAVTPGWLEGMGRALRSHPRVGGVLPLANPPRRRPGKTPWAHPPWYRDVADMEWFGRALLLRRSVPVYSGTEGFVPGFWFLTKRSVIDEVGLYDERFSPGSYEDWDLQVRMRRAGYRLGFAGRAYVHHVWSGSIRGNGLGHDDIFSARKIGLLWRKHPRASGLPFSLLTPSRLLRKFPVPAAK